MTAFSRQPEAVDEDSHIERGRAQAHSQGKSCAVLRQRLITLSWKNELFYIYGKRSKVVRQIRIRARLFRERHNVPATRQLPLAPPKRVKHSSALEEAVEYLNQPLILLIHMVRCFDTVAETMAPARSISEAERVKGRMQKRIRRLPISERINIELGGKPFEKGAYLLLILFDHLA
ncbi:MAG TPA: hypothetical protein VGD69_20455 [Herpetosiphonaceae bacterium]